MTRIRGRSVSLILVNSGALTKQAYQRLATRNRAIGRIHHTNSHTLTGTLDRRVSTITILLRSSARTVQCILAIRRLHPKLQVCITLFSHATTRRVHTIIPSVAIVSPTSTTLPALLKTIVKPSILTIKPTIRNRPSQHHDTIQANSNLRIRPCAYPSDVHHTNL